MARHPIPVAVATCLALSSLAWSCTGGSAPAHSVPLPDAPPPAPTVTAYTPSPHDAAQNRVLEQGLEEARARSKSREGSGTPRAAAERIVYYSATGAPSFRREITRAAQIWNDRTDNVTLVSDPRRATLRYYQGTSPLGSFYQGRGRGDGIILIDVGQAREYPRLRIVSHETGHAVGLPDRYTQPCSKLMSGGGPGPTCDNPYPDADEADEVDLIWAS